MAPLVKKLLAMWEVCGQSRGWEDTLKKGMATHSSILAWRILWTGEPGGCSPWDYKDEDTAEWLSTFINFSQWLHLNVLSLTR